MRALEKYHIHIQASATRFYERRRPPLEDSFIIACDLLDCFDWHGAMCTFSLEAKVEEKKVEEKIEIEHALNGRILSPTT